MAKKEARFAAGFFRYGNKKLRVGDYVLGRVALQHPISTLSAPYQVPIGDAGDMQAEVDWAA
jgi:hypothetical protein